MDVSPSLLLKWGVDAEARVGAYDYFSAVRAERSGGSDTSSIVDTTRVIADPRTDGSALYLAPRLRLLRPSPPKLGVRLDRNSHLERVDRRSALEPVVVAAHGHDTARRVGKLQSVAAAVRAPGAGRRGSLRAAERAEQRMLGLEQALPFGLTARDRSLRARLTSNARSEFVNVGGDICSSSPSCRGTACASTATAAAIADSSSRCRAQRPVACDWSVQLRARLVEGQHRRTHASRAAWTSGTPCTSTGRSGRRATPGG